MQSTLKRLPKQHDEVIDFFCLFSRSNFLAGAAVSNIVSAKVPSKHADVVANALIDKLSDTSDAVLTLTADNGKEFALHEQVATELGAAFFFANPYHSWERGLNGHTNGLIRQYFHKGRSLDDVTQMDLDKVEFLLNNRPRKVLKYATPIEVFQQLRATSTNVALRS